MTKTYSFFLAAFLVTTSVAQAQGQSGVQSVDVSGTGIHPVNVVALSPKGQEVTLNFTQMENGVVIDRDRGLYGAPVSPMRPTGHIDTLGVLQQVTLSQERMVPASPSQKQFEKSSWRGQLISGGPQGIARIR